jgi:hypothetical protein
VVLPPKFEPTDPEAIQWLRVIPYRLAGVAGGTAAGGLAVLCALAATGSNASAADIT